MFQSLEDRMRIPAYFHTLTDEQIDKVIADARAVIFDTSHNIERKRSAGTRLHYASEEQTMRKERANG